MNFNVFCQILRPTLGPVEIKAGGAGSPGPAEDSRMPGALARKRCDPAKKYMVKHVTFGPEVAPFPSERRGPFSDPPPLSRK